MKSALGGPFYPMGPGKCPPCKSATDDEPFNKYNTDTGHEIYLVAQIIINLVVIFGAGAKSEMYAGPRYIESVQVAYLNRVS
jgi:hypothetical protein